MQRNNIATRVKLCWAKAKERNQTNSRPGVHNLYYHALNISLCVEFVKPCVFTGIQRVTIGCYTAGITKRFDPRPN